MRTVALALLLIPGGCHWVSPLSPAPDVAGSADGTSRDTGGEGGVTPDGSGLDGMGWSEVYKLQPGPSTCPPGTYFNGQLGGCAIPWPRACDAMNVATMTATPKTPYQQVRGFVQGLQYQSTDAFATDLQGVTIDGPYVEGVSFTYGTPRKHLWTFASALLKSGDTPGSCPGCMPGARPPPPFVGTSWTCDSGNLTADWSPQVWYTSHPLWDGDSTGPGCATPPEPGWFQVTLPQQTSDDIEVRILFDSCDENVAVTELELYVR